jgi:predicted RNase H-like HicB family nuclease
MGAPHTREQLEESSRYEIVVTWDETDKVFLAVMPELPGVIVPGDTPAEAVDLAVRAGATWLASERKFGGVIPAPKSMVAAHS